MTSPWQTTTSLRAAPVAGTNNWLKASLSRLAHSSDSLGSVSLATLAFDVGGIHSLRSGVCRIGRTWLAGDESWSISRSQIARVRAQHLPTTCQALTRGS